MPTLDHVDFRVADIAASTRFYDTVLGVLGLRHDAYPDYTEWGDFSIAADGRPLTRHAHIAFVAATHGLVDAFHRAGIAAGYADAGAPGPRPRYRPDYYGAFLLDPDGNSVEAVCTDRPRRTGAIDHVWLRTPDVAAIRRFYAATSHTLGVDEPDHVQILLDDASVSYVAGEPVTEHVHLAFGAAADAEVDAFHAAAMRAGYRDNGAPGERLVYHPGYYGAFVLDPDGHNVEAVNHNRGEATTAGPPP